MEVAGGTCKVRLGANKAAGIEDYGAERDMNRRVRNRTHGGVGGGTPKGSLLPDCWHVRGARRENLFLAVLQRRTQDVAERSAGVGRAVLGHRFLLLGDFQRLDRHRQLARLLVVGDDACIDLLADREALGALLVAVVFVSYVREWMPGSSPGITTVVVS